MQSMHIGICSGAAAWRTLAALVPVAWLCALTFLDPISLRLTSASVAQVAGVQYILDSVVQSLQRDRNRKFVFAEMARR